MRGASGDLPVSTFEGEAKSANEEGGRERFEDVANPQALPFEERWAVMFRWILFGFVTLCVIVAACVPAMAANPLAGRWKVSTSYLAVIPDQPGSFDLPITDTTNGHKNVFKARWITEGKEFEWTDAQGSRHNARVDPRNPNRIEDVNSAYPRSPGYWYRLK